MEAAKPKVSRRGRQQRHSLEFKISIARQVIEAGKSQTDVSRETNVAMSNVHKWIVQARAGQLGDY
jgi:transposase-like protein